MKKMLGPTFEQDPRLTLAQAARILGVSHQAVVRAIDRGSLQAEGPLGHRRVRLTEVIAYGVRNGRDVEEMWQRAQKELNQSVDWTVLIGALVVLGFAVVIQRLLEQKTTKQEAPLRKQTQKTVS